MNTYQTRKTHIGQLPLGADLYEGLMEIVKREDIRLGRIQAIGATTHAIVAYYDQNLRKYLPLEFSGGMEILSCNGNVSIRDGKPFLHAHILLGDREGNVFGGHLLPGTKVFACEAIIEEFEGDELVRERDDQTGLYLWQSAKML